MNAPFTRIALLAGLGLLAAACTEAPGPEKPASDPDLVVAAAKADAVSNYWTTMRGDFVVGETFSDAIDWPDYYLGRTADLRAGQKLEIKVSSDRKSIVRVYGPAYDVVDGQPLFKKPLVKVETKKIGGQQVVTFTADIPEDGTYMLLYAPKFVWAASYDITVTCLEGCLPADACAGDDACPGDEFCGWNGVACIRAPCDVAYDICQARKDVAAGCSRDRECAEGLRCTEGKCTAGTTAIGGACGANEDCADGFCGCADWGCSGSVCKAFAAEGEVCGGFRPASSVTMCSPKFDCVAPYDIIADIPGHCGAMVTVAQLVQDPRAFDGRFVAVKGVVASGPAFCTKIACSDANPCCNACSAWLRLFDTQAQADDRGEGVALIEDGEALGCSGNECTVNSQCDVEPGGLWVAGWFRVDEHGQPTLKVTSRFGYGR